jgi:uncharacterized protein (TIRG00374 family)
VLFFPGVYLSCVKWRLLLIPQKIKAPFSKLFWIYLIGSFFNNFTPGTIGSDVSRVYYTWSSTGRPAETAASIIVERATGILALVIWCAIASIINYELARSIGLYTALGVCFSLAVIIICIVYLFEKSQIADKIRQKTMKFGSLNTMLRAVEKVFHAFYTYRNAAGILGTSLLLSLCFHILGIFSNFLLFYALGMNVNFYQLMLLIPIINLASLIPISISSWGIREGAFVLLFGQLGLTIDQAMAAALVGRVLLIIASLSGAVVLACAKLGWLRIDWQPEETRLDIKKS